MASHSRSHTAFVHRTISSSGRSSARSDVETTSSTALNRRRKSPSPEARIRSSGSRLDTSNSTKKRGSSSRNSLNDASVAIDHALNVDGGTADRGRKQKSKAAISTQSRLAVENADLTLIHHRASQVHNRKDRDCSQSREGLVHSRKDHQSERSGTISSALDVQALQEKIEFLKKGLHDSKKAIKRQQKTIDRLEKQLQLEAKVVSDKDDEMQRLKSKYNKNEELISSIEANMQCQICLDILHRPFALSPCGHILCMLCLQEWFRQAPVDEDDMYDDDDPDYLMHRRKSCPCCRTTVGSRPIPVFLVKTIATSLMKAKPQLRISSSQQSSRASPSLDTDPWEDIFPPIDDDNHDEDGQIDEDEDDDDEEDDEDYDHESGSEFGYSTGTDEEQLFVPAQWEPPDLHIRPDDRGISPQHFRMLRRGATEEMIARFHMGYTHHGGLRAVVSGPGNKRSVIYLGWNITLSPDDRTGQEYIDRVLSDVVVRPERWHVNEVNSRKLEITALIPAEDLREYLTTDTEAWTDDDDNDLD